LFLPPELLKTAIAGGFYIAFMTCDAWRDSGNGAFFPYSQKNNCIVYSADTMSYKDTIQLMIAIRIKKTIDKKRPLTKMAKPCC